jgi:hypothetical protein
LNTGSIKNSAGHPSKFVKAMKSAIYPKVRGESGRRIKKNRLAGGLTALICLTGLLFNLTASSIMPKIKGRIRIERPAVRPERLNCGQRAVDGGWIAPTRAGNQWVFSQPFDSETPDIDPVMVKSKRIAAFFIDCSATRPRASSTASRIATPIYLVHKSLLC